MRNTRGGSLRKGNVRREIFSSEMRIETRRVDLQRGAKDIQLPAISRSRLARPCRLMSLPVSTVTAQDCGRSCDRDIGGFYMAASRGRITRENSNCRKRRYLLWTETYAPHYGHECPLPGGSHAVHTIYFL